MTTALPCSFPDFVQTTWEAVLGGVEPLICLSAETMSGITPRACIRMAWETALLSAFNYRSA